MVVPKDFRPFFLGGKPGKLASNRSPLRGRYFPLGSSSSQSTGSLSPLKPPSLERFSVSEVFSETQKEFSPFFALNCTDL